MSSWLSGYSIRKKLSVDNTKISADLFNFPCDVILRSTNFDFTKSTDNGFDIRFCEANGITHLAFERERHDNVALKVEYKKRLPFISSAAPTDSYLYYKNDPAIPDGQNPTAVWDTATKARWSLKEDPSGIAPQMKDSTINANHGTAFGMTSADSVEGKIGKALDFDGVNDFIDYGNILGFEDRAPFSVGFWIFDAGFDGGFESIIHKFDIDFVAGKHSGWSILRNNTSNMYVLQRFREGVANSSVVHYIPNQWNHVFFTYDGTTMRGYLNGVMAMSIGSTLLLPSSTQSLQIGGFDGLGNFIKADIDEIRIYNRALTAAEIKASFNSGNDTLLTYGAEERGFILTGALTFSGILTRTLTLFKILTGALTFSGTLTKNITLKRILTGILTFKGRVFSPPSFKESDVINVKLEEDRGEEVEKREL